MIEDKEIKRWIDRMRKFLKCYIEWAEPKEGDENVEALKGLLALAERYLAVGEMLPQKSCTCNDPSCEGYVRNKAIKDCRLAYTKQLTERLEGLEWIITQHHDKWEKEPIPQLKDGEICMTAGYCRSLATAISNHIANVSKRVGKDK